MNIDIITEDITILRFTLLFVIIPKIITMTKVIPQQQRKRIWKENKRLFRRISTPINHVNGTCRKTTLKYIKGIEEFTSLKMQSKVNPDCITGLLVVSSMLLMLSGIVSPSVVIVDRIAR